MQKPDPEEVEASIALGEVMVSICAHIARLDGQIDEQDEELLDALIQGLFGDEESLFPEGYLEDEEEVQNILYDAFEEPYDLAEILELGKDDEDLAVIIYDTAEEILLGKEVQLPEETQFLNYLKKELNIKA
ncbi:MAG TPA: hypothetical protein DCM08_09010 [Microscillaceae bacterium]|jgi:uncharacterized membrane protein YebE (DUF533 family)|nr:hypothetical protein [Microscillaceae bacterium]